MCDRMKVRYQSSECLDYYVSIDRNLTGFSNHIADYCPHGLQMYIQLKMKTQETVKNIQHKKQLKRSVREKFFHSKFINE